jgi:hypothetical protein
MEVKWLRGDFCKEPMMREYWSDSTFLGEKIIRIL